MKDAVKHTFSVNGGTNNGYSYSGTLQANCLQGATLPEVNGSTITRKKINPNYFKGKITVINFWFMACKPCIEEIPDLNKLVKRFGNDEINYLAIGIDDEITIQGFLKKTPFNFDIIPDGRGVIKNVFKSVWGYPLTIITDKNQKIIKVISRSQKDESSLGIYEDIEATISPYLDN